jgi:hypothetical protein
MQRKQKLLLALWAALVAILVIDPLASTGLAAKGVELWNRLTKPRASSPLR